MRKTPPQLTECSI